jgi:hypothetical protein
MENAMSLSNPSAPKSEDTDSQIIRWINRILLVLGGAGLVLMVLPQLIDLAKQVKDHLLAF